MCLFSSNEAKNKYSVVFHERFGVKKEFSFKKVRNFRIAHRKYIGMVVNSILLAKYFIL